MRILAFDLSFNGPTGWVLWDNELDDPIVTYGEFQAKASNRLENHVRDLRLLVQISKEILELSFAFYFDFIAYERTDWHRNVNLKSLQSKARKRGKSLQEVLNVEFAIERNAMWSLGMARAAILLTANEIAFLEEEHVYEIGAMEAKREFGAGTKKAAAELFAIDHPRFRYSNMLDNGFLFDELKKQEVSDHISDAFIIASVVAARLRKAEMIAEAV